MAVAHATIASPLVRRGALVEAYSHYAEILPTPTADTQYKNIGNLTNIAYCQWLLGFPEQAVQRMASALDLRRKHEVDKVQIPLHHYSSIALFCGDVATVDRLSAELVELTTQRQDDFSLRWGMIYRGWLLVQQGQIAEGICIMRENADEHRAAKITTMSVSGGRCWRKPIS
ncbi:MAG: hypothetical protein R2867_26740 [Caldilineaceae bacterium]